LKILLVNHFPLEGSGSGIYTKNIAQNLIKKGHQVRVIVVDSDCSEIPGLSVKTIQYFRFPCFTTHPKSTNKFSSLSREEMNEYLNKFLRTIKEEAQSFNPDLIHCQHIWIAPYAALMIDRPYVITAHGTDIKGYKEDKRYMNIAIKAAAGARKIITISKQVHRDVLQYYGVKEDKLSLIGNGFDKNIFRKMSLNRDEVLSDLLPDYQGNVSGVVNFVGKLTAFKGVDLLIKAAEIYEKALPGVITLISGDGELREELMKLVEEKKLKNLYFLGNRSQELVAKLYNIADVSVVPSRVEPYGLVALEALACGTPVIASNSGGLPEFINDQVGFLFPMDDYKALAEKVIYALQNDAKEQKGDYAAEYALENYSWEKTVQELIELYEEVIGNNYIGG
jgi:glycosyltransferase involved in cell wall biosynthesis